MDEDFDINLNIDHFSKVKKNLNNLKHKLAFTDNVSDQVHVHGLIGVNIIPFIDMKMIKCMNGIAWNFPQTSSPVTGIISSTKNRLPGRELGRALRRTITRLSLQVIPPVPRSE